MKCFSLLVLPFILTTSAAMAAQPVVPRHPTPPHPYMFNEGANSMHRDSYQSDTHEFAGPENRSSKTEYFRYGWLAGMCASFVTDSQGNLISVCVKATSTDLYVVDSKDLSVLAEYSLPRRQGTFVAAVTGQFDQAFKDTSGGSYFYLDNEDRVVVPTSSRQIWVIGQHRGVDKKGKKKIELKLEHKYDLSGIIQHEGCPTLRDPDFSDPRCDKLTTVLPDWQGRYWFTSRYGIIGTVDRHTGQVRTIRLRAEQIQNSFAMAEEGPYIISDNALYALSAAPNGAPQIRWREKYDRGTRIKLGQINQGSGSTPTLFGPGYVAVTDNADPQLNLLVYHRGAVPTGKERKICQVPLFTPGKSACENSVIGVDRTMVVGNTYGYDNALKNNKTEGGMARVDVREDESGCDVVWQNKTNIETATPELSLANGLVYIYTRKAARLAINHRFYLTAVDMRTGKTEFSIYTGRGRDYDNAWGTLTFAPDGTAYVGVFRGMVRIRDTR